LCKKTKNVYWNNLAKNDHFYDEIECMDKRHTDVEVFDFTMEDNQVPYIVANGMVIHNSIGKKLPKLMAELKAKFIAGANEKGLVEPKVAEEIFGWIEKCQRYSFNKSHAASYAKIGYQTAWMKCHFPPEFFTSWLTHSHYKSDPKEEIYKLVQDARLFNVPILSPDIRLCNVHFKMLEKPEKSIGFGLAHIRSVGQSAIKKLVESASGSLNTWRKFLSRSPFDFL